MVVFVTGGAWTIGYKAWGAILGRRLSQQGVIVACIDYRNFPQARRSLCPDMELPLAARLWPALITTMTQASLFGWQALIHAVPSQLWNIIAAWIASHR